MHALRFPRPLLAAAAALALVTAACGGGGDTTGPSSPAPAGDATITVVNHAPSGTVMYFRHRACGTSTWGSDHLGTGILGNGEQISFDLAPGCYDFRATPSEVGLDYLYFNGVSVAAGEARTLEITSFPAAP